MPSFSAMLAGLAFLASVSAHLELTYPGTRGNNLQDNVNNTRECKKGTNDDYNGGDTGCFPYGMEWMYPCGGLPITTNRTYWPTKGGAVAFQPGWFSGHSTAYLYVNLGIGEGPDSVPANMSHPMVPMFQISGPTNEEYPGRPICIPQVGMPANLSLTDGQNATIQVVMAAKHGAALYSCVDITLTDDISKVEEVTPENCYNDTNIQFNVLVTSLPMTGPMGNGASAMLRSPTSLSAMVLAALVSFALFTL